MADVPALLTKVRELAEECDAECIKCVGLYLGEYEWGQIFNYMEPNGTITPGRLDSLNPYMLYGIPMFKVNVKNHWNAVAVPKEGKSRIDAPQGTASRPSRISTPSSPLSKQDMLDMMQQLDDLSIRKTGIKKPPNK